MNFKIFTTVITLEFTDKDTVVYTIEAKKKLELMEDEIKIFLSNKKEAKLEWHQSTGSVVEMLIQSKGIPFTQITAIVYW